MEEKVREATFTCGGCLEEIPIGQLHEFDGRNLCPECFRNYTHTSRALLCFVSSA